MKNDLVYYIHDGSAAFRFRLSGNLCGDSVPELEQTWRTASSIIGERVLVVDLTSVTAIDGAGCGLLSAWHAEGAALVITSAAARERVESILERPVTLLAATTDRSRWSVFHSTAHWIASVRTLLFPGPAGAVSQCGLKSTSATR